MLAGLGAEQGQGLLQVQRQQENRFCLFWVLFSAGQAEVSQVACIVEEPLNLVCKACDKFELQNLQLGGTGSSNVLWEYRMRKRLVGLCIIFRLPAHISQYLDALSPGNV